MKWTMQMQLLHALTHTSVGCFCDDLWQSMVSISKKNIEPFKSLLSGPMVFFCWNVKMCVWKVGICSTNKISAGSNCTVLYNTFTFEWHWTNFAIFESSWLRISTMLAHWSHSVEWNWAQLANDYKSISMNWTERHEWRNRVKLIPRPFFYFPFIDWSAAWQNWRDMKMINQQSKHTEHHNSVTGMDCFP